MGAAVGYLDVVVEKPGRELRLRGALNVRTVPNLRADLQRALEIGEGDLLLHLGEAEIHDATGLGVLVGAHHRALRRGRRLVIAEASDRLERLLRVTKLHLVLARVEVAPPSGGARPIPMIVPLRSPR